jgi:DNA-binding LacI/PurR family transcriptional regulator
MRPGTPATPRPAAKRNRILDELRRRIVGGRLKPGGRLPTRLELRDRFRVSVVTVQSALEQLTAEGFVEPRGRGGTYVADAPPHLSHYGLVLPIHPAHPSWSLFPMALCNQAKALEDGAGCQIHCYYGVDGAGEGEDWRRLLADVNARRLAGLIFLHRPDYLARTPLFAKPRLPMVAIADLATCPGVAVVNADWRSFFRKAVACLAAQGRRRVAHVAEASLGEEGHRYFAQQVARQRLRTWPHWSQAASHANPVSARNVVRLLMAAPKRQRPDGLVLSDDNIVEHALAGLLAAGVRVPRDVEVVAYANFPWAPAAVLPVRRFGFHARQILESCLRVIDRQRRGQRVPAVTRLEALDDADVARLAETGSLKAKRTGA